MVIQRCSVKKVFLKILQNSQENTCARVVFLIKLSPATLLKKRLWYGCFSVNLKEAASGKRRNIGSPYLVKIYCCGVKCVRKWRVVSHYFKYFKDDIVSKTNICNTENLQQVPCRLSLQ